MSHTNLIHHFGSAAGLQSELMRQMMSSPHWRATSRGTREQLVSSLENQNRCDPALLSLCALGAIPADEVRALEAHVQSCDECHARVASLRPIVDSFAFWPSEVLCPSDSLREKLATRISAETRTQTSSASAPWVEPGWEQAAPGISCKLLATDSEHDRVSMLVRLDPGVAYPPHTHAGREELHLLEGELWIEDRKLYPGDYNRAEAGTADKRVWSETGCACVLITSIRDVLA